MKPDEAAKCTYSRCALKNEPIVVEMKAKIKQLRCKRCNIYINNDTESLDTAVNTCKNSPCQLRDLREFSKNIKDRLDGKPKELPKLLQQPNVNNPEPTDPPKLSFEIDIPDPISIFIAKNGHVEYR